MLVNYGGLLPVGEMLGSLNLTERLEDLPEVHCVDPDYSHGDVLSCMIAMICLGKPDYDAVEVFRNDDGFFAQAMGISGCPSSSTVRQRIDLIAEAANGEIKEASTEMIKRFAPAVSPIATGAGEFIPVDMDVTPFDNSKTQKEGVSRTYKSFDGYAPILAYIGKEGYELNVELRNGSQHCQKNTPEFIRETLTYARQITADPLLVRLDSGNDSQDNYLIMRNEFEDVEFIVKRNLRKEPPAAWLELAGHTGDVIRVESSYKTVWTGRTMVDLKGNPLPYPIVFNVTSRNEIKGEKLLFPEIEAETYWCTLPDLDPFEVIKLYHDHGTSEQFHSEIKSDLGLERLPSGSFKSNSLILHLALLAYNILRIIGQVSLEVQTEFGEDATLLPIGRRKPVFRRRLRTVMQDYMHMAGRLMKTGGRFFLSFGKLNPFAGFAEQILLRLRICPG